MSVRRALVSATSWLLLYCAATYAVTGQQMQIQPTAAMSWQQIEELDARMPLAKLASQQGKPFMPMPSSREIGVPGGQKLGFNSLGAEQFNMPLQVPLVVRNFQSLPDNLHVIPPDTHGAVGIKQVMTMLNSEVRIQDKVGNVLSTVSYPAFWASTGANNISDPHVLFDQSVNRWYASSMSDFQTINSSILLAVSDSANALATWKFYKITADPTHVNWADYPDIGFNGTWIAISANMFTVAANNYSGTSMWVVEKSTALSGGPLITTFFPVGSDNFGGFTGFAVRVCQTFGSEPKLYLADNAGITSAGVALLRLSELSGTGPAPIWTAVSGSSFPGTGLFAVAHNFSNNQPDAQQAGTTVRISTNDTRLLNAVFRNGRIWCTNSGGLPAVSPNHAAVFWYEINPTTLPTPIVQSGVVDDGVGTYIFFPSIAVNSANDAFIGFTRCDSTKFAEAAYTGRKATDPTGTMSPVAVFKAGESSYTKTFGGTEVRWGDFSATVVDPTDSASFWTIQEYAAASVGPNPNDSRWGTWWGTTLVESVCGDANSDSTVDITDVVFLVNYIFAAGPAPSPLLAGDANCDKIVDVGDAVYLVQYIFAGGPPPCAACLPI